jgi:hypothetical protein
MSTDMALERLVMIDRADSRHRAPLRGLMECAGLRVKSVDGATDYDITTASVITDTVALSALSADHVFLPFTMDSGSDLGRLQTIMLTLRTCHAVDEYDYAYFGPPVGARPVPEVTT